MLSENHFTYSKKPSLFRERALEILGASEIKATQNIEGAHLSGLRAFREEHTTSRSYPILLLAFPKNNTNN